MFAISQGEDAWRRRGEVTCNLYWSWGLLYFSCRRFITLHCHCQPPQAVAKPSYWTALASARRSFISYRLCRVSKEAQIHLGTVSDTVAYPEICKPSSRIGFGVRRRRGQIRRTYAIWLAQNLKVLRVSSQRQKVSVLLSTSRRASQLHPLPRHQSEATRPACCCRSQSVS